VGTALLMGAAIPAMHYTGMAAAQFRAASPHDLGRAVDISILGAYAIAAGTMLVLAMAIATSLVSRYGEARLRSSERRYRTLATELQKALTEVRTLEGILPICASCKRIKNEAGGWEAVEVFVRERTDAEFSHGLCPDCAARDWGTVAS
jgi:signaling repeat-containing protein